MSSSASSLPPASPIIDGVLYQGDWMAPQSFAQQPDVHIACATELPPSISSGREIIFLPLRDDPLVDWIALPDWSKQIAKVARLAARRVARGRSVLVTCAAGLNRSGLVVALTLCRMGMEPRSAIKFVRLRRSPYALGNPRFVEAIKKIGLRLRPKTVTR